MLEVNKKDLLISMVLKVVAIISSIYGMSKSFSGMMFFTYFTNLSNIFIDIILFIFLIYNILLWKQKEIKIKQMMYIIKFMATISITLTFFVYMLLLAPTHETGFINAYFDHGAGSLCVHFINPVLAIIDFLVFDYHYKADNKHVYYAIVPPLVYVGYILILGQLFQIRWNETMLAPYNFLNYGSKTGWLGFDLSLLSSTTLGIGCFYMIVILVFIFIGLGTLFLETKRKV